MKTDRSAPTLDAPAHDGVPRHEAVITQPSRAIEPGAIQRALANPSLARPETLLQLQRMVGNAAVQRAVEQERRISAERKYPDTRVSDAIAGARGAGVPLDSHAGTRASAALGANVSGVRLHTDGAADALCDALEARAFATGGDIFFRNGAYAPETGAGRQLLAHELVHVVQQGNQTLSRAPLAVSEPGDPAEREAEAAAGPLAAAIGAFGDFSTMDPHAGPSGSGSRESAITPASGSVLWRKGEPAAPAAAQPPTLPADVPAELRTTMEKDPDLVSLAVRLERAATARRSLSSSKEEHGTERKELIGDIAYVREKLAASKPEIDDKTRRAIDTYFYQKIAAVAPFYTQMANANILSTKTSSADVRTCNITTVAMALEGLGKSVADFKKQGGDLELMNHIAQTIQQGDDVTAMRLPDFLQILTIYVQLGGSGRAAELNELAKKKDGGPFAAIVDKAAGKAANMILYSGQFEELTILFGVKASRKATEYNETLDLFGEFTRGVISDEDKALAAALRQRKKKKKKGSEPITAEETEQLRAQVREETVDDYSKVFDRRAGKLRPKIKAEDEKIDDLQAALPEKPAEDDKSKAAKATRRSLEKAERNLKKLTAERSKNAMKLAGLEGAASTEDMEEALPIEEYQRTVLATLSREIDSGKQVIVALRHHFVRLQSISKKEIIVDDPGSAHKRERKLTWEEARSLGYFLAYIVVG